MITFTTTLQRFETNKESSNWTYFVVPQDIAQQMSSNRRGFRVKGKLDDYEIKQVSLAPMGDGSFILPFNKHMRKVTGKQKGDPLYVQLELDPTEPEISPDLLMCLEYESEAKTVFNSFTKAQQRSFSYWVESAKTDVTKSARIERTINGLLKGWNFPMLMSNGKPREE